MTSPRDLHAFILERLAAQPNLQVFDGAPDDAAVSTGWHPAGRSHQVDVFLDEDGRAHIYACLYIGQGWRDPDTGAVCSTSLGPRVVTFQVTAAGGDQDRALRAAQKVVDALDGIPAPGRAGVIHLDADTGPLRVDRDPKPSRSWLPLFGRVELP